MMQISAFPWVPPFAQGYVRDFRVRWALEEAGLPYKAVLIDPVTKESASYRAPQTFGQVPAFREGHRNVRVRCDRPSILQSDRMRSLHPTLPAERA